MITVRVNIVGLIVVIEAPLQIRRHRMVSTYGIRASTAARTRVVGFLGAGLVRGKVFDKQFMEENFGR